MSTGEILIEAIQNYREAEALDLVKQNSAIASTATEGNVTALHWACMGGMAKLVDALVKCGADVNALNDDGEPPLFWAVTKAEHRIARLLCEEGAKVDVVGKNGFHVYHHAAKVGNIATFEVLRKHGERTGVSLDINVQDATGRTPLSWTCSENHHELLQWLVFKGASIQIYSENKMTPMHWAALGGGHRVFTALLRAGGNNQRTEREDIGANFPEDLLLKYSVRKTGMERMRMIRLHKYLTEIDGVFEWRAKAGVVKQAVETGPFFGFANVLSIVYFAVLMYQLYLYANFIAGYTMHWMFWQVMWIVSYSCLVLNWLKLRFSDPGRLIQKSGAPAKGLESLREDFWKIINGEMEQPVNQQLCITCKILRPERAKHDLTVNTCVDRFDQFSPLVNNAVGRRNYYYFLTMLFFGALSSLSFNVLYGAYLVNLNGGQTYWQGIRSNIFFTIIAYAYLYHCFQMMIHVAAHLDYITMGFTTNEIFNSHRYKNLSNFDTGTVRNPYRQGTLKEELRGIYSDCGKDTGDLLGQIRREDTVYDDVGGNANEEVQHNVENRV